MALIKKSETVPKGMEEKYQKTIQLTNSFAEENLNKEYAQFIRYAIAALCRSALHP
jgi:hypothetical protein